MGKSRYAEIVDSLVGDLAGCQPGERVASEHEIAARFGVSRAVAGAALRELESRLLVRRIRGSGTFVNGRIDYVIAADRAPSWHRAVRDAGAEPRSAVRSVAAEKLPDDLAARLERGPGSPAHRIIRQSWINGMPSGWAVEWIPDDVFPDGADVAVRAVESLDQVLRQMAKVEPVRAWCRVGMELPPPEIAAGLEIDPGRHVWLVESVSRDATRRFPIMTSIWWTRPDVVRVIVEMSSVHDHCQHS
jgi:GntR family transcriptional regulator, phosphonate transport system regulatory protein